MCGSMPWLGSLHFSTFEWYASENVGPDHYVNKCLINKPFLIASTFKDNSETGKFTSLLTHNDLLTLAQVCLSMSIEILDLICFS